MAEVKLAVRTGLGREQPLAEEWPGFSMREITGLSVWWMSVARGDRDRLDKACEKHVGTALPPDRRFVETDKGLRILWAGDRQWFVIGEGAHVPPAIARLAAVTDQSDGWVAMRVAGERTRAVMERLCLVDLDPAAFPTGTVARTPIEGMHALIACDDAEAAACTILFQRSSARSFVDHFRHAADSACGRD